MIEESELPELIQKPELIHLFDAKMIVDTIAALWKVARAAQERQTDCSPCACSKCEALDDALAALDDGKEAGK